MCGTRLTIVWNNPTPPQKSNPKVKRVETGKFTTVYLITKPAFTNRLAVVRKRVAGISTVNSASA